MSEIEELSQMFRALVDDGIKCVELLTANDSQSWRRAYARALFALIEGSVFRLKQIVKDVHRFGGVTLSAKELALLDEEAYDVNDKGEPYIQPKFIPLTKNVKFTFKVYGRTFGSDYSLRVDGSEWATFKESIEIRNRISHPKRLQDLKISDEEMDKLLNTGDWFRESFINLFESSAVASRTKWDYMKPPEFSI